MADVNEREIAEEMMKHLDEEYGITDIFKIVTITCILQRLVLNKVGTKLNRMRRVSADIEDSETRLKFDKDIHNIRDELDNVSATAGSSGASLSFICGEIYATEIAIKRALGIIEDPHNGGIIES